MAKTVRELQEMSHEVVDVFWNLLRFYELKGIDLEKAFLEKYQKNEERPLEKAVTDISENA